MLNFKACGTPLNIMQSSKYFAQIFFIMIGTTSKGGTVNLVTFIFLPLAKGHPNIYIRIFEYSLNDVTVIRLRFYAVIHSPNLKPGLLLLLLKYFYPILLTTLIISPSLLNSEVIVKE